MRPMSPAPPPSPHPAAHRGRQARAVVLGAAAAVAALAGCGYHLAGHGSTLPPTLTAIGIPVFVNKTSRPELEQRVTEHVIDEFTTRGRVKIRPGEEGADAVLQGTLYSYATTPVLINQQGRAQRYEILITARVVLKETKTDKVLWEDDHFLFKRQYDVAETSVTFVDQETIAIDQVATDFAQSVVTSILEGF
jgi:outer membrane lipopolysaccharide assembly protein LptE/RlpB